MPRPVIYTPEERAHLIAHYATGTREALLAAFPTRKWSDLQKMASTLGAAQRPRGCQSRWRWTDKNIALLLKHYPSGGSLVVAALTGFGRHAVNMEAARRGVRYTGRPKPVRPPKPPKEAKAKVEKVAKPRPEPKPRPVAAPLLSVKRSPQTPVLNMQKEARKKKEEPKTGLSEAIARHKQLPYGHPEHLAFLQGGLRGWHDYLAKQPAASHAS